MFPICSAFSNLSRIFPTVGSRVAIEDPRAVLTAAVAARGDSLAALSAMLGRNPAYLQQYVVRGSPKRLGEEDRRRLADYFGIDEEALGATPRARSWRVPRLDVSASAGPGALVDDEVVLGAEAIDPALAAKLGLRDGQAAIVRVRGDSMEPGLVDGDLILVDLARRTPGARGKSS